MSSSVILISGASGFLGRLAAAKLLLETPANLILPVRAGREHQDVLKKIQAEVDHERPGMAEEVRSRVRVFDVPREGPHTVPSELAGQKVDEIIHSAGCLDYFNREALVAGNIELTRQWLEIGRALSVSRFTFVSTAFSCGMIDDSVEEVLHSDPDEDPTVYTWSKREAERLVSSSGLDWMILRPSIVVGDSRCGRYGGRNYGLYQLWRAFERFLSRERVDELHFVAPRVHLPIIHQDAFQSAFLAAYQLAEPNSIVHIVGSNEELPTVREVHELWMRKVALPESVKYHDRMDDVPLERLNRLMRMFIEFAAVNMEISSRHWPFARTSLDTWERQGLVRIPATNLAGIERGQDRFVRESTRLQRFMRELQNGREELPAGA